MESVLIAIGGNALYDKKSGNNLSPEMLPMAVQAAMAASKSFRAATCP